MSFGTARIDEDLVERLVAERDALGGMDYSTLVAGGALRLLRSATAASPTLAATVLESMLEPGVAETTVRGLMSDSHGSIWAFAALAERNRYGEAFAQAVADAGVIEELAIRLQGSSLPTFTTAVMGPLGRLVVPNLTLPLKLRGSGDRRS